MFSINSLKDCNHLTLFLRVSFVSGGLQIFADLSIKLGLRIETMVDGHKFLVRFRIMMGP